MALLKNVSEVHETTISKVESTMLELSLWNTKSVLLVTSQGILTIIYRQSLVKIIFGNFTPSFRFLVYSQNPHTKPPLTNGIFLIKKWFFVFGVFLKFGELEFSLYLEYLMREMNTFRAASKYNA